MDVDSGAANGASLCARCCKNLGVLDSKRWLCSACFDLQLLHGKRYAHWSDDPYSSIIRWAHGMPRRVLGTSTGFARFVFTCIPTSASNELPVFISAAALRGPPGLAPGDHHAPGNVWPMPPPFRWHSGQPPRSSAMRARWRRVRAIELLVNLFVCLMSYLHLGRPRNAPRPARFRDHPPTLSQVQVLRGSWDDCSLMAPPAQIGESRGGQSRCHLRAWSMNCIF